MIWHNELQTLPNPRPPDSEENLLTGDHVFMQQVLKTGGVSENTPDFLKLTDKLLYSPEVILPADS